MAASPVEPVGGEPGRPGPIECRGEQAPDLADGEGNVTWVGGWFLVRARGRGGPAVDAPPELGGGDGTGRERGHDEDEVAADRGVEAGLALVEAEVVLPELESFLNRPLLIPVKWKPSLAARPIPGR